MNEAVDGFGGTDEVGERIATNLRYDDELAVLTGTAEDWSESEEESRFIDITTCANLCMCAWLSVYMCLTIIL